MMLDAKRAVDAYTEAWADIGPARRSALLEECWADDGVYCDPLNVVAPGREALAGHIAGFSERFPGHSIKATSRTDAHDGFARFAWMMTGPDGQPVSEGVDFVIFAADGRIARIVGFFGPLPALEE